MIKVKPLQKGDTIGVIAPSSCIKDDGDRLQQSAEYVISQGYNVKIHPQCLLQNGNHAGTEQQKIQAIHDVFQDHEIKAVFCARGGNGLLQYLDQIDYGLIRQNPKPFVGFSDITALHHGLLTKIGLVSFHGPNFQYMSDDENIHSTQACLDLLSGHVQQNLLDLERHQDSSRRLTAVQVGKAQGALVGGNLTLLSELMKTSDFKPSFANNIVFFEDTKDYAYKHDRQLAGLFLNEEFRQAKGLIIGVSDIDPDEEAGEFKHPRHSWADIVQFYLDKYRLNIPVVVNAPISHAPINQTLPHGALVKLDVTENKSSLTLLETPFLS